MNAKQGWFEVDRAGLARVAGRRTKVFILRELIQNAWDENSTMVTVEVHPPVKGSGFSTIIVTDDSPEGFADLTHAYTLFAPSAKVANAQKRGRFNFGEKLVLALCVEARIETTKGTVLFDRSENRRRSPKKTEAGSRFIGTIKLTAAEREALIAAARAMIPPVGKRTMVNGLEVFPRTPVTSFDHVLMTEIAGEDGTLKETYAYCKIGVHEVLPGETAHLYEMGIPVVETGDRWHVDIGQKVPLNMERDNVRPNYLADVRAATANHTMEMLTEADANAPWARDAMSHHECKPDTVKRLVELRFGDKVVVHDPNDQEANQKAASHGYVVVTSSQLSGVEWNAVRNAGAIPAAGTVFPTPKPFTPGGRELKMIAPDEYTCGMTRFARLAHDLAEALTGQKFLIQFANDRGWPHEGCIGGGAIIVNHAPDWYDDPATEPQIEFLIHELAHTKESNHLSDRYHDALCKFGARAARLAVDQPELFR